MTTPSIPTPSTAANLGGEKLSPSRFSSTPTLAAGASDKHLFQTAQKWVSQTFFGTLLKQMHESPFKSDLWSGGRGGQAFSPLYDQHLAERMAKASGRPLANSIVKHIQRGKAAQVK
jgi:Rod binding domain-containing protein